ncbi:MAG: glycine cleavage system protein GcvH [bacterium]
MNIPQDLKYSKEHEWAKIEGKVATIGITDYAQSELGDIVFAELPDVGKEIKHMQEFGVVESVKTVSNLYAPLSGKVVSKNDEVISAPEKVNHDPYGSGWLIKIEMQNEGEVEKLLSAEKYKGLIS